MSDPSLPTTVVEETVAETLPSYTLSKATNVPLTFFLPTIRVPVLENAAAPVSLGVQVTVNV